MHVLFNNAGILIPGGFEKVSLQQHKAVVDVNFIGVMNTTHLALPLLKQTPNSCVVTMCSASSMYGNPEILAYAATKSAVKSLTEGWNMLFRKHDIRVCDILPAYVNTNMVTDNADEMKLDQKDIKLSPEAIAQAVWEASHSNKMHHYTGTDAKASAVLKRILPSSVFQWVLEKTIYKEAIKKN